MLARGLLRQTKVSTGSVSDRVIHRWPENQDTPVATAPDTVLSSLEIARPALRLLGGSFGIVGCRDEFLSHRLCIIVIAAELHSLLVLVNGLGAIALGVVGVAAFDARP